MEEKTLHTKQNTSSDMPVLLGFIFRVRSFNELNNMIKEKEFNNVIPKGLKLPKIDAIRDTLKVVDLLKLRKLLREIVYKARENKVFDKGTIEGFVVVAFDGTQTFEKELKFIKFHMKKPDKRRTQLMIVTTCMHMDLCTVYKIIRTRQDIENSIFHNLKMECGLEHCFVHSGKAIEAVLCLIYIASNMVQLFYYRRIKKSLKRK